MEVWLQMSDRCQSYLPPGPQVSFGLSLSSVSADNVLRTTISFNERTGITHPTTNLIQAICAPVVINNTSMQHRSIKPADECVTLKEKTLIST